MAKICVNNKVIDHYRSGMSMTDAINAEFGEELNKRIENDGKLKQLTPMNIALMDAGISK